jgi:CubicO group peptidase (beta-lactamase class C family)
MLFIENKLMERTSFAIFMLGFMSFWVTREAKGNFAAAADKSNQAEKVAEAKVTPGVASQTPRPNFDAVSSLMRARVASGVPSIAIAIAHHGRIVWEEAIGVSDHHRNHSSGVGRAA